MCVDVYVRRTICISNFYLIFLVIVYIIAPDVSINAVVLFEAMMRNQIPIPTIH